MTKKEDPQIRFANHSFEQREQMAYGATNICDAQ